MLLVGMGLPPRCYKNKKDGRNRLIFSVLVNILVGWLVWRQIGIVSVFCNSIADYASNAYNANQ